MSNPIGHLSHKEFNDLTNMERVQVIVAYNDFNKFPSNDPGPNLIMLKQFWNDWNYEGESMPYDQIKEKYK